MKTKSATSSISVDRHGKMQMQRSESRSSSNRISLKVLLFLLFTRSTVQTNYLTGSPNASLKLFANAPVTESNFDFLPDGYTFEIDRDPEHPSVRLFVDGKQAETLEFHYQYYYDFYCAILENMPEVYAIFFEYDYPGNHSRYRGHYDILKEYRRTAEKAGSTSVTRYFCMEANQYLYYVKETDAWYGADGNLLKCVCQ